jgi:hypothetical protein
MGFPSSRMKRRTAVFTFRFCAWDIPHAIPCTEKDYPEGRFSCFYQYLQTKSRTTHYTTVTIRSHY